MTALYGALMLRQGSQDPQCGRDPVARMQAAEAARPTGRRSPGEADAAFGAGIALGLSPRPTTAEEAAAPDLRSAQGVVLAARCRLDNRPALLRQLHAGGKTPASDADLVLALYLQHGTDCVDHLVGDWSFALWDGSRQRLLLARDATGNSPLFWWQGGGRLLFASSLPTLLAAGPVPTRPDPHWLAGLLTGFSDPAQPTATAFTDVHALPPGHLLVAAEGRIDVRRWWQPETQPPLDGVPVPELESQFLALYDDAVRQRLRRRGGTVAATLSGGLDSGSVVALAAPALAAAGQRLTAYVHTPRFGTDDAHPQRLANEWAAAQATARHVGNVDAIACPTETLSPMDGIRRWLDIAAAPSHSPGNWYWLLDIVQQARATGAEVLLTGQGGNTTVSFNGSGNLWPRLRSGHWSWALQELQTEEAGWIQALQRRLIKPALRPAWRQLQRAWRQHGGQPGWAGLSLLNPHLASALGLDAAMAAAGHDAASPATSARRQALWRLGLHRGADTGGAIWSELSCAHDIDVRDPTRDQRLVELCWRLPDEVYWSHGRQRGLVRTALRTRLPAEVRDATRKGLQSADLRARLRHCRDDLLAEIAAVARHPVVAQWIDVPRLELSAGTALDGAAPPAAGAVGVGALLRALAAAMFIARHA